MEQTAAVSFEGVPLPLACCEKRSICDASSSRFPRARPERVRKLELKLAPIAQRGAADGRQRNEKWRSSVVEISRAASEQHERSAMEGRSSAAARSSTL